MMRVEALYDRKGGEDGKLSNLARMLVEAKQRRAWK